MLGSEHLLLVLTTHFVGVNGGARVQFSIASTTGNEKSSVQAHLTPTKWFETSSN